MVRYSADAHLLTLPCSRPYLTTDQLCIDRLDPDKCDALIARGRWLQTPHAHTSVNGHNNWQPAGCMLHDYDVKDMSTCLKSRRVAFIGDSVIRQIFWAFVEKLDVPKRGEDKHSNISVDAHGLKVDFVWDPYLNTSSLHEEVARAPLSDPKNSHVDRATIIVVGGGLWHARHLGESCHQHFEDSIDKITRALQDGNTSRTSLSQASQSSGDADDLVLVAPVLVPQYDALSPARARTITPARVERLLQYLQQSSIQQNLTVAWSFSHMTRHEALAYEQDGLHVNRAVASEMANVLINRRCNVVLRQSNVKGYPMDKTCCNKYKRPNRTQSVFLIFSLVVLPVFSLSPFRSEHSMSIAQVAR